ncbi:SRPBCC family protein [Nocardia sp. CA-135398]|uniref:SRPBCC family protein n=1 Tax=Nocardia sp. CA-135398 TaxID=3239977 RepID=UPI003D95D23F
MAVDVSTEAVIERPRTQVAAFAGDPSNAPQWYANIDRIEWRTEPPLRVGSRMEFVARFLGRQLVYTYEVIEYTPGERLVMRTAEGPFPMQTTYTWADDGPDRTRMILRNTGTPSGFGKVAAPLMEAAMRRANRADLARLRALLEA